MHDPEDRSVVCKYLSYRYSRTDGSSHVIRLPLIHVSLKSANGSYETVALVDTGATRTIIPREFADELSLRFKEQRAETVGAGGTFVCQVATLQKLVLLKNLTPFCTFMNIDVLVPEHEGIIPYVILGRDYVFKRFDITFHEKRQKITFTKI